MPRGRPWVSGQLAPSTCCVEHASDSKGRLPQEKHPRVLPDMQPPSVPLHCYFFLLSRHASCDRYPSTRRLLLYGVQTRRDVLCAGDVALVVSFCSARSSKRHPGFQSEDERMALLTLRSSLRKKVASRSCAVTGCFSFLSDCKI